MRIAFAFCCYHLNHGNYRMLFVDYLSLFFLIMVSFRVTNNLPILFFPGHAPLLMVKHCSFVSPVDQNKSPGTAIAITVSELRSASQNSGQPLNLLHNLLFLIYPVWVERKKAGFNFCLICTLCLKDSFSSFILSSLDRLRILIGMLRGPV